MRGFGWIHTPIAAAQPCELTSWFLLPFSLFPLLGCETGRGARADVGPASAVVASPAPLTRSQKPESEQPATKPEESAEPKTEKKDLWSRTDDNGMAVRVM